MTAIGGSEQGHGVAHTGGAGVLFANLGSWLKVLVQPPRRACRGLGYRALVRAHLRKGALLLAAVVAAMLLLDPFAGAMRSLPRSVIDLCEFVSDLGRSGMILIPCGLLLVGLAILIRPALDRWSRAILAAVVVRIGFVFVAVGLPGLVVSVVKRLIGRVRPSSLGPFAYVPLSWRSEFASLPSGHSVTVFSVLVAAGAVWPATRPVLWIYALAVALSRIVVSAHFPSDVIAGAAVGAFGAILVREWFAARRLGFITAADGSVRALPPPSAAQVLRALATAVER